MEDHVPPTDSLAFAGFQATTVTDGLESEIRQHRFTDARLSNGLASDARGGALSLNNFSKENEEANCRYLSELSRCMEYWAAASRHKNGTNRQTDQDKDTLFLLPSQNRGAS